MDQVRCISNVENYYHHWGYEPRNPGNDTPRGKVQQAQTSRLPPTRLRALLAAETAIARGRKDAAANPALATEPSACFSQATFIVGRDGWNAYDSIGAFVHPAEWQVWNH